MLKKIKFLLGYCFIITPMLFILTTSPISIFSPIGDISTYSDSEDFIPRH